MNLNKSISWKVVLPVGIILAVIFHGGAVGFVGDILVIFGLIDLFRQIFKRKTKLKQ
jgi:hypothetical protein